MYTARIASTEDFRTSRDAWNSLAQTMMFPTIFCSWEWIHCWWEHFGAGKKPVIIFIHDGAKLKGVLPLFVHRSLLTGVRLGGRILQYCGTTDVYPDHLDIISAGDDASSCLAAAQDLLSRGFREWDVLHLPLITADSALAAWTKLPEFPFTPRTTEVSVAPYIPLNGNFEGYIGGLDKKTRYNIRSRRKKLDEQHQMRYVRCDAGAENKGLDAIFSLHELRANKKGINSTFEGGRIRAFHDDLVAQTAGKGWISLSLLQNDKETIAASYNFCFGNRVFSYQKGSHPGWGQFGPGNVILHECISDAFARGNVEYNLLQGNEPYKYDWTSQSRALLTANLFNTTVGGRLSLAGYRAKNLLKSFRRKGKTADAKS